jgi:hypothetical protein
MKRNIYINFTDLSEETQQEIMEIARQNVIEEDEDEIRENYDDDMFEQIVSERAEREIYNINYVFNV